MPKKLVCTGVGKLEWQEQPRRSPDAGQVLIRAEHGASKHGTEMAVYKGQTLERGRYDEEYKLFRHESQRNTGGGMGNMIVGVVEEVAKGAEGLRAGDRVLAYGGFQEFHVRPVAGCWKMPAGVSWQSAVCLDPADFAVAAVRDGHVRLGDAVAVFGMGAIGLVVLQVAKLSGAFPVIAVDPLPNRRKAAQVLGADLVLDPAACDAGLEIKKATAKRGADVVIEYSGSRQALQDALRAVAYGGNVVAGAFPGPYGAGLDFGAESHLNIPNLIFTRACSEPNREHPRWNNGRLYELAWRLITEGKIRGEEIVTPVVPFDKLLEEYPKIATDPGANIKLGVKF